MDIIGRLGGTGDEISQRVSLALAAVRMEMETPIVLWSSDAANKLGQIKPCVAIRKLLYRGPLATTEREMGLEGKQDVDVSMGWVIRLQDGFYFALSLCCSCEAPRSNLVSDSIFLRSRRKRALGVNAAGNSLSQAFLALILLLRLWVKCN